MARALAFDSELPGSTQLYRITDFFAVAELIQHRRMYVASAARFQDANEGVEEVLSRLAVSSGPCSRAPIGYESQDAMQRAHDWWKAQHYVSSWTRARDSVALWGLYSTDLCSVQVRTSAGKLRDAVRKHLQRFKVSKWLAELYAEGSTVFTYAGLLEVRYATLADVHRRIQRRNRAYQKVMAKDASERAIPTGGLSKRDWERYKQTKLAPFSVKDVSYGHEAEVRILLRGSSADAETHARAQPNEEILATRRLRVGEQRSHRIVELRAERAKSRPAPFFYLDVPQDFVDAVVIDPRCPPHKRKVMEEFFEAAGIPVEQSSAFGYFPASWTFGGHAGAEG